MSPGGSADRDPVAALAFEHDEEPAAAPGPGLAMVPMIDVVFLLIIFFMCSQFHTLEGELLAKLPERAGVVPGARVRAERVPASVRIYVSRRPDGGARYLLNGAALEGPGRLFPALAQSRRDHPDLEAILDGDDTLPFEPFLFAFDECLRAGIERVNLVRPKVPVPED